MYNSLPIRLLLLLTSLIFIIACADTDKQPNQQIDYKFKDISYKPGIKIEFDIALKQKITEEQLKALAIQIHEQQKAYSGDMYINYYIEGINEGGNAWATTHFRPNLEVKIYGLTAKEESAQIGEVQNKNYKNIVGKWIDDDHYLSGTIVIYREGTFVKMDRNFKTGKPITINLSEHKSGDMTIFKIEDSGSDDYYTLDNHGKLKAYDKEGFIKEFRRI